MKGLFIGICFVAIAGCWPVLAEPPADAISKGYTRLTFSDEFNDTALDRRKWIDCYPDGERTHTSNELQYYATDSYYVRDGLLTFRAEKRNMGGQAYTSGMVASYSKFSQQFGWFEIRARAPKGIGFWPAFWLLPDNKKWPPEIDIMEVVGLRPTENGMNVFYRDPVSFAIRAHQTFYNGPDFTEDFHTFAVEWTPVATIFYIDGVERARHTANIPQQPMYLIANLAIGSSTSYGGAPTPQTVFPSEMKIDYIRIYQNPAYISAAAGPANTTPALATAK